jgi:uncharacterized protein YcgI (DUF1989 family)
MLELKSTPSQGRELEVRVPVGDTATFALAPGQFVNIATNGELAVGSLFAFASDDRSEWLSVGNTRILLGTLGPRPGKRLFSNRRRALLVWIEDSGGGHDLLLPLGATARVEIPALERLGKAFAHLGVDHTHVPDPLNLFLDARIDTDGHIKIHPSSGRSNDYVVLRATTAIDCAILAWSLTEAPAGAGGALAVDITNQRPMPGPAAGH